MSYSNTSHLIENICTPDTQPACYRLHESFLCRLYFRYLDSFQNPDNYLFGDLSNIIKDMTIVANVMIQIDPQHFNDYYLPLLPLAVQSAVPAPDR